MFFSCRCVLQQQEDSWLGAVLVYISLLMILYQGYVMTVMLWILQYGSPLASIDYTLPLL